MSAIVVCGNKRSFFHDLDPNSPPSATSPSLSEAKRLRCSSHFSPPANSDFFNPFSAPALLNRLRVLFPAMDDQILEKALEECGNDLDAAIKRLTELRLGSSERNFNTEAEQPLQSVAPSNGDVAPSDASSVSPENLPKDGSEWVELLVTEMGNASNMDDAKARASRVLELLESSIRAPTQNIQMENMVLKEQIQTVMRENSILKRAVTIQHERQKEHDVRGHELQHLKQMVSQYQEQLKTLEVNNYALTVHLKQAQQSSSIPGRFHPDVF